MRDTGICQQVAQLLDCYIIIVIIIIMENKIFPKKLLTTELLNVQRLWVFMPYYRINSYLRLGFYSHYVQDQAL